MNRYYNCDNVTNPSIGQDPGIGTGGGNGDGGSSGIMSFNSLTGEITYNKLTIY
nr:hypothetical protein [Pedobacter sp. ASV19]